MLCITSNGSEMLLTLSKLDVLDVLNELDELGLLVVAPLLGVSAFAKPSSTYTLEKGNIIDKGIYWKIAI